jgi:hypothetical protein
MHKIKLNNGSVPVWLWRAGLGTPHWLCFSAYSSSTLRGGVVGDRRLKNEGRAAWLTYWGCVAGRTIGGQLQQPGGDPARLWPAGGIYGTLRYYFRGTAPHAGSDEIPFVSAF